MSIFANAAVHPAKGFDAAQDNPHDAANGNPSESMTFPSDSPFLRKSNGVFSTLWQWKYYWSHAGREMKKRKCNFFLGVLCCFLVVLIAAFCYTLISKAPVVFLSQGEASNGQIDVQFTPTDTSNAPFLNYTQMVANTAFSAEFSNHAPRLVIGGVSMYDRTCTNYINGNFSNPSDLSWRYDGDSRYPQCAGSWSCLPTICPSIYKFIEIDFYDTASEKAMGLGRLWPYAAPPVGTAIVHSSAANRRGIRAGDTFWVTVPVATWPLLENILVQGMLGLGVSSTDAQAILQLAKQHPDVVMPIVAKAVTSDMKGKFPTSRDSMIAMEYSSFLPALIYNLHPAILNYSFTGYSYSGPVNTSFILSRAKPKEFATEINTNLGGNRVDAYMSTNYDLIQKRIINFSSRLIYFLGFPDVDVNLGILRTMNGARFFVLYLGLILSVILTILFILATMLIYSLLLISIETRTFELGVHRMVGMKRLQIVQMLLTQALSYAIPAWIVGLIVAQGATFFAVNILEKRIEVPVEKRLIPDAIGIATFLGIFMPLVAATLPIRNALSRNLHDSLDTQHSKTLAVKITITRTDDQGMSSAWIVVGLGLFVFGFCIYYLVPLALLSFNLALFFNIFFALLIGMLLGLIVLSLNFEHLLEQFLTLIFFWWENRAIRSVTLKNLVAHRMRNRKTTIMYALALGFIIFITVAFSMELKTAVANGLKGNGAEMTVTAGDDNFLFYPWQTAELEQILAGSNGVADWTWVTGDIGATTVSGSRSAGVTLTNLGHISETGVGVFAVSPNFYDVALSEFLIPSDADGSNGLSLAEQLYTATGSQTALLGTNFKDSTAIESLDTSFILAHPYNSDQYNPSALDLRIVRPGAFLDASPLFTFSKFPATNGGRQIVISIPTYMRMTNGSLSNLASVPMKTLLIKFTASATDTDKDNLLLDLQDFADINNGVDIFDYRDSKETMDKTNAVMSLIFGAAAYIAMGLCMFSLMASMFTNIYEQTKEIAILRAMGLRRFQIVRIYIYEAFVLVAAASCLGVLIGTIMAWTMMLQRVLFTQVPLTMDFPYILFLEVLAGAAVVAVLSSFTPAYTLVKKSVSQVMRTVV